MFPEATEEEPMAGSSSVAPPAGPDQLDLEAAEQLIQLSGGDGADDNDDAGSESRSADSVKCRGKEKELAAVESRRRSAGRSLLAGGKDGNSGEPDSKGVDSFACNTRAADVVEKDRSEVAHSRRKSAERCPSGKKDRDGGIAHGEARRRPRFRSLADIYRETEPRRLAGSGESQADRDPAEGGRKTEKKRPADEVISVDPEARKARRSVPLAQTRM